jgi:predicted dithiol-disulfide oxidoreductase (DUF899 family)
LVRWIDEYSGVAPHLAQNVDFAIVAAAEPYPLRIYAHERGWHNLRLVSAGESAFKSDLGSEDADGAQDSAISVLRKIAMARCGISIPRIREWRRTLRSGASIYSHQYGTY